MSYTYTQYCMIGKSFRLNDIKKVISEEQIEYQDRYDPRTGKPSHKKRVVVKQEIYEYSLLGHTVQDPNDFKSIFNEDGLDCLICRGDIHIGKYVKEPDTSYDYHVYLLDDKISENDLTKIFDFVKSKLGECDLIFMSYPR